MEFSIPPHVQQIVHRTRAFIRGSLGISTDLPLGTFYREARAFRIYEGPREEHRVLIARDLLEEFSK